ncbi:MAG: DUF3413 domain-containing protein [Proteobacteria bacterium]|nr:DUF3413 domain-containing protein [Pseudomonadota bacterium]
MNSFLKKITRSKTDNGYTLFLTLLGASLYLFLFSLKYISKELGSGSLGETAYIIVTTFLNPVYLAIVILFPLCYLLFKLLPSLLFKLLFFPLMGVFVSYVYIDSIVFNLFKFHVNSFVLKVLGQKDALMVLGIGAVEIGAIVLMIIGGTLVAFFLYNWISHSSLQAIASGLLRGTIRKLVFVVFIFSVIFVDKSYFAWLIYNKSTSMAILAKKIPLYIPAEAGREFKSYGFAPPPPQGPQAARQSAEDAIHYPLAPFVSTKKPGRSLPNIILLMSDTFRSDVYNPKVMPNSIRVLEKRSSNFVNHFSGSNGTTEGLFTLLYGLPATYMGYFSKAEVSPILFDALLANNYQIKIFSSKSLGWMGTDQVVFSTVKEYIVDELHRDSVKSDKMINERAIATLETHAKNPEAPLFLMVFYDSPHLPHFSHPEFKKFVPDETSLIFDPSDKEQRIRGYNQYWNAVNYVDHLLDSIYKKLEEHGYFDNSVILLTGDHGSEKYEHGHWGHASAFTNEQLRVPMVVSLPNRSGITPKTISRLTSHMDFSVTLLELMGETYDSKLHSIGKSLFDKSPRGYIIAGGITNRVLIDKKYKIDYTPFEMVSYYKVTDFNDIPVKNSDLIIKQYTPKILRMFDDFSRFMQ